MKEKELVCPNKYCYVYNVSQTMDQDRAEICHNCGSKLITRQPHNKREGA